MSAGAYTETAVSEFGICILSFNFQIAGPSQGEVRKLDSAWRYLDLEDLSPASGSKIRGETRNLDSGWPAPVLGNFPVLQNPGRGVESGIWMARAGSWKLVTSSPLCFCEPVPLLSFSCALGTRNLGMWKLRSLYRLCVRVSRVSRVCPGFPRCLFTGTACMLVSRNAKGRATSQGPRRAQRLGYGLARARVAAARAAGGSASRRSTLASSPHRLMRGRCAAH
jgi:hypothetical protein